MKTPKTLAVVSLVALLLLALAVSRFSSTELSSRSLAEPPPAALSTAKQHGGEAAIQQTKSKSNPDGTSTGSVEEVNWGSAGISALLEALRREFRSNPQAILDTLAQRLSDSSKRETLEMALFSDWASDDPLAAIAAARNCRFRSTDLLRVSPVRIAVNQWASSSPAQAAEWLITSPWYAELAEDHRKSVEAVFVAWGRQSPDRGLDWLARHQRQLGQSSSSAITSLTLSTAVYGKDFITARDIAQLHPEPEKRAELLKRISDLELRR